MSIRARDLNWRPHNSTLNSRKNSSCAKLGPLSYNIVPANFGVKVTLEVFEEGRLVRNTHGIKDEQEARHAAQSHADAYVAKLAQGGTPSTLEQALHELETGRYAVKRATEVVVFVVAIIRERAKAIEREQRSP